MILDLLDVNHVTDSYWLQVLIAAAIPLIIGVFFKQYQLAKTGRFEVIKQPV